MHQKLAFARNPRFPLPPQVQLLRASLPSKAPFAYRALGSAAGLATEQVSAAAATPGVGVFRLEPPEVVFRDYGGLPLALGQRGGVGGGGAPPSLPGRCAGATSKVRLGREANAAGQSR
jgi:hypothetical protein